MNSRRTFTSFAMLLTWLLASTVPAFAAEYLGLPSGDAATLGMSAEKLAQIPAKLASFVDKGQVPGFVTIVAREGKVVHFEASGSRDVERKLPMTRDTIFRMYSMTKPITGTAIMILIDEGKIKTSDKVSKYIPEFKNMTVLEVAEDGSTKSVKAKNQITIQHLLTHTGGLVYGIFDPGPVGKAYNDAGINSGGDSGDTLEEFAAKAAKMPLASHPGEMWNYSISMDILGRVVEVVTGERFGDYLDAKIFKPLGMKDSGFQVPRNKINRFAANYGPSPSGGMTLLDDPKTSPFLRKPSLDSGGGGMVGTGADYLRFAQMLLNGGELDGVRIISERAADEMTTNHLGPEFGDSPLGTLVPFPMNGVGFGYCGAVVKEGVKQTIFGGAGEYTWGGYASTDFWIDKKEQLVGIVLTQLLPTGTYPTRIVMHNAAYAAISQSLGSNNTD